MSNIVVTPVNIEERKALGIKSGDAVKVWQKIKEKDKFRLQAFEGIVISQKHGSTAGSTFTVRKVIDGVGVEKIFPLFSPMIDSIELVRRSKVRSAKLYYVREKAVKEIKKQMRKTMQEREIPAVAEAVKEEKKEEKKEETK